MTMNDPNPCNSQSPAGNFPVVPHFIVDYEFLDSNASHLNHSYQFQQPFPIGVDIFAELGAPPPNQVDLHAQSSTQYVSEGLYLGSTDHPMEQHFNGTQEQWPHNIGALDSQETYRTGLCPYYPSVYQPVIQDMSMRMNMPMQDFGNPQLSPAYIHLPAFDKIGIYPFYDPPQRERDTPLSRMLSRRDHVNPEYSSHKQYLRPSKIAPAASVQRVRQIPPAHDAREEYLTISQQIPGGICRFSKDDGTECGFVMNEENVDSHIYGHLPKVQSKNERIPRTLCWWKLETGKQCGQLCKDAKVLFRHVHTHHKIKVVCPYPLCEEHLSRGRQDVILNHMERIHRLPKHPRRKSERNLNGERISSGYPKREPLTWDNIRDLYGGDSDEWTEIEMKIQKELDVGRNSSTGNWHNPI
ncbi:hypothetical protein GYMLUDRAFT_42489 [Collybiopsis luxurians FD-317 M1]|uniref:Uncharacterized protein n=1 Tax=Collybiopsis luxurians FD-317 M1 TaxID=944289 RepID=A0A0D0CZN8_9AGAR|nr:hypothetical protein GYMLUDRAFT_42489 [Collybiopsis luxurians FD-317 M1]